MFYNMYINSLCGHTHIFIHTHKHIDAHTNTYRSISRLIITIIQTISIILEIKFLFT
jgi:hypothetical protein